MEQPVKFTDLPLSDYILQAVEELGFVDASPIQSAAIPVVMTGTDVIGQAQTGTGKTAAFGIPAIENVDTSSKEPQVLVLCPTRELALQVKEQIQKLAKYKKGLSVAAIFGGESYDRQFLALKKSQIVVGTPGRIQDHIDRKTLNLSNITMVIMDEADEMLNMGFREDMEKILSFAPSERQTLLFSATMSPEILSISKRFLKSPEIVKVTKKEVSNENIEQFFFSVRKEAKMEVMSRLIDVNELKLVLVFCNTKSKVDEIVSELQIRGYGAEGLHGDMRQQARTQVMSKFRAGVTTILVATDVAARGIDVKGVDGVINFDMPMDLEYYVHRIGRTGRAGKLGKAFMLISGRDKYRLRDIENYTKVPIQKGEIPTLSEMVKIRQNKFITQIKESILTGNQTDYTEVISQLEDEGFSTSQILSSLIQNQIGTVKSNFSDAELSESYRDPRARNDFGSERRSSFGSDRRGDSRGGDSRSSYGNRGNDDRRGGNSYGRGGDERRRDFGGRDAFGNTRSPRPENREGSREFVKRGSGDASMVRLFLNLGRKDNVAPNHIVGAITSEARIPGRAIGQIDVYDKFSFVEIPQNDVRKVIDGMKGKTINAREASFEIAKV